MTVLITGGTGFIGSFLTNKLTEIGMDVFISGTDGEQNPKCKDRLDLNKKSSWKLLKKNKLEVVYHLAANNDTLNTDYDLMNDANVRYSMEIFNHALDSKCTRFVYASSTAIYGNSPAPFIENKTSINPLNVYAKSKVALEHYASYMAKTYNLNMVGLRFCNVYGPGEDHKGKRASMICQLYKQMLAGNRPRIFKDGLQKRDWIFVEDACSCLIAASKFNGVGVFNCGSGKSITFIELIKIINKQLKTTLEPEFINNTNENSYQSYTKCDMKKTKEQLGFEPKYDVIKGICEICN
jgi:ADP-L-glycero-D-manno-heptose 6-epimerase